MNYLGTQVPVEINTVIPRIPLNFSLDLVYFWINILGFSNKLSICLQQSCSLGFEELLLPKSDKCILCLLSIDKIDMTC